MQGKKGKVVFKPYFQGQLMVLPPSLDELIEANHPVRVVNEIVDKINLEVLYKSFDGGGAPVFHPKMMLKVLIYAYVTNIYSSRKIEAALKENIHFMWLSGMNQPDHNTINRFRGNEVKDSLRAVFTQVVMLLVEEELLSLNETYVDGTKLEANAGRYTFVWAKAIKTNKEKIASQLKELWEYSQKLAAKELSETSDINFEVINPEKVKQTIAAIDEALVDKKVDPKIKAKLNRVRKVWPEKLKEYEQKEEILDGRNSYAKTDPDATFMRMKDDHMGNGQLKPGYNIQISTNEQFVIHYSVHQTSTDTTTLVEHMDGFEKEYEKMPEVLCADAGYGSEENYEYLEKKSIQPVVKYNTFRIEKSKTWKSDPYKTHNLFYNQEKDYYVCPMGQHMTFIGTKKVKTTNGYEQTIHRYQAQNCAGCPLRGLCYKAKADKRTLETNPNLNRHKAKAKEILESEEGIRHRKKRCTEVETVFGNIKQNHGFRRMMLRGLKKVETEFGLLALAQNIRKKVSAGKAQPIKGQKVPALAKYCIFGQESTLGFDILTLN